jgi:hypothetical protein
MAKIVINKISITNKVNGALTQKRFQGLATNAANTRYVIAKQIALEEFNKHPITLELEDEFGRSKQYLAVGNLFSFFGFLRGSKPVERLRLFFQNGFQMDRNPKFEKKKNGVVYKFDVKSPILQDLYKQTPMPDHWSTTGWLQAIEEGIGTFASYIWNAITFRNKKESRSGQALQIENSLHSTDGVLGVPYVSEILDNFRSKFSKK